MAPDKGHHIAPRDYLLVRWKLAAEAPGVVFADVAEDGYPVIGTFNDHLLAADAVAAHNAVLRVRPGV